MLFGEIAHSDGLNVLVEDHAGDEEALRLVALLLVEIGYPLHAVDSIDGGHEPILRLRISLGVVGSDHVLLEETDPIVA